MIENYEKLTLETIGNGVAKELFERALEEIIDNIDDANAKTTDPRKINLEFIFKPSTGKEFIEIQIKCNNKLAQVSPIASGCVLQRDDKNRLCLFAPKNYQPEIFELNNVKKLEEKRG